MQGGKWYFFSGKLCVRTKWMITMNFRYELWTPRTLNSKFGELLNFCLEHKPIILWPLQIQISIFTAQKMDFFSKDFFSKCEKILKKSLMEEIMKKSLMENFILCAVIYILIFVYVRIFQSDQPVRPTSTGLCPIHIWRHVLPIWIVWCGLSSRHLHVQS